MKNEYPYRFHIGTQKAGSTFLFNLLSSHKNISLSDLMEINYFTTKQHYGDEWYFKQFKDAEYKIDTSPKYFMMQNTGERIRKYTDKYLNTEPLFSLILRNPIDYLNSHFQMHLRQGHFKKNPKKFPTVPTNLLEFVKLYPFYMDRAKYYQILNNYWLPHFKKENFKIIIFEKFIKDKESNIRDLLNFFQIPYQELETTEASKNKMPRNKFISDLRDIVAKNKKMSQTLRKNKWFNSIYDNILTSNSKNRLDSEDRQELAAFLLDDVRKLKILGIDTSLWKDFN